MEGGDDRRDSSESVETVVHVDKGKGRAVDQAAPTANGPSASKPGVFPNGQPDHGEESTPSTDDLIPARDAAESSTTIQSSNSNSLVSTPYRNSEILRTFNFNSAQEFQSDRPAHKQQAKFDVPSWEERASTLRQHASQHSLLYEQRQGVGSPQVQSGPTTPRAQSIAVAVYRRRRVVLLDQRRQERQAALSHGSSNQSGPSSSRPDVELDIGKLVSDAIDAANRNSADSSCRGIDEAQHLAYQHTLAGDAWRKEALSRRASPEPMLLSSTQDQAPPATPTRPPQLQLHQGLALHGASSSPKTSSPLAQPPWMLASDPPSVPSSPETSHPPAAITPPSVSRLRQFSQTIRRVSGRQAAAPRSVSTPVMPSGTDSNGSLTFMQRIRRRYQKIKDRRDGWDFKDREID